MSLELVVAMAIIIGISEIKEWRAYKRAGELDAKIDALGGTLKVLMDDLGELEEAVDLLDARSCDVKKQQIELLAKFEELTPSIAKAELNTETILKEYEINGIPLGMQRKRPDFVEGF